MTDVATLGFAVDTGSVKAAQQELSKLEQSGHKVETTAERMARQFNQAMGSMKQTVRDAIDFFNKFERSIDVLQLAFAAATGNIRMFAKESSKLFLEVRNEMEKTQREASKMQQSMSLLQKALVFAGVGVGINQLMEYTDVYGRIQVQLGQATKSQYEYNLALTALYKSAQQTGQSLDPVVQLFSRMSIATENLAVSQKQLLDVTDMVNKMLMTAQLPAASAEAALFQFSQAMSVGTLRGEELNSVMEQMPPLAQAIARGLGVTTGEMRKMAAEGQLTSQNVLAALLSQKEAIDAQFESMMGNATTMSNMMARADSAMMMLIGRAD
ncbi:MAG: tape measure protein, partial [Caldilineaceae bacterium]|nr:tape measure protein [Caldilineaceae bacterium]